jgi:signal transduction histidine kinase
VKVAVERELLARMLQPLTDNARRYGGTSVALELTRDTITAHVRVIDDGPGVTTDEADSIFAPGWRGSAATDTDGAGLGLALARRLARSVGGDVIVTPSDRGGRFELEIPISN